MSLKIADLSKLYFYAWQNKSIDLLYDILDDHVKLIDWELNIEGKKSVLDHNQTFFQKVGELKVDIVRLIHDESTAMAELIVKVDNFTIPVVDVLTFNKNYKIEKITAYKRA